MNSEVKSVNVTKNTTISIDPFHADSNLEQPLWAINWFNLKSRRLYDFYNLLVKNHVKKVGGQLLLKGVVLERWEGKKEFDREMLLIVNYPSADAFLKMISNKFFLLKSIIRIRSVKDFVFGFVDKQKMVSDIPAQVHEKSGVKDYYVVHFYQKEKKNATLKDEIVEGVNLFFHGCKAAELVRTEKGKSQRAPFFIDGLLIWRSESTEKLKEFINSKLYQDFKKQHISDNIYLFDRIL
jgi:uncharacterized protein (DUF1330 family)